MVRLVALIMGVVMPVAVHADCYWTGAGTDDLWSNPANWSGGVIPNPANGQVHINNAGATITNMPLINASAEAASYVWVGETAGTGIQASLTGHLVFSTPHTNSAAGAFPRS